MVAPMLDVRREAAKFILAEAELGPKLNYYREAGRTTVIVGL